MVGQRLQSQRGFKLGATLTLHNARVVGREPNSIVRKLNIDVGREADAFQ